MADAIKPPRNLVVKPQDMATTWNLWLQQYKWYTIATKTNKKDEEVQAATLLACLGEDAAVIFNNFGLSAEEQKNAEIIIDKFTKHFVPTKNLTFERFKFNKIQQESTEAFDDFLTRIFVQSKNCEFGVLNDELVKDKIVIGIANQQTRERLLTEQKLTLEQAIKICKSLEETHKQMQIMEKGTGAEINVIKNQNKFTNNNNKSGKNSKPMEKKNCTRCGRGEHRAKDCPALKATCNKCQIKGHYEKCCKTSVHRINQNSKKNKVNEIIADQDERLLLYSINGDASQNEWWEYMKVNNHKTKFKIDTGAQCNVVSMETAELLRKPNDEIKPSKTKYLLSFSNHEIKVLGEVTLNIESASEEIIPIVFKVVTQSAPIIGFKDSKTLGFLKQVAQINFVEQNPQLFRGLGELKNFEYEIDIKENPNFEIKPARRIPHSIEDEVRNQLNEMEKMGVIRKITEPTPVVSAMVIVKKNSKLRICIDPTDVNKNLKRRHYPLKTLEYIAAKIKDAKYFTKLDCNKGFWQIKVSARTEKYLAFATPWGRYTCTRLPFGLSSAPEIFQQVMSKVLEGIPNVESSMDDILIYAATMENLDRITSIVMKRIKEAGLVLNKEKCCFGAQSVKFLGHVLSKDGLQADKDKIEAIHKLEVPNNVQQLQRLLGMVNYLNKFIPNLSELTEPLRLLLNKDIQWIWGDQQQKAFEDIKQVLTVPPVLAFYDVNKDVTVSVDASGKAVGAALIQDGRPIAYATRSLTKAQQNYPSIEREALAIKIACQKFHQYIYGKKVIVETDHKPLETIFKKSIHQAPIRLQRILLEVAQYNPIVTYKKGTQLYLADPLSRDCKPEEVEDDERSFEVQVILPITDDCYRDMVDATLQSKELQELIAVLDQGWPGLEKKKELPECLQKYWNYKEELSHYEGLVFKGRKLVVPESQRTRMLKCIHHGHFGIETSQRRAREYMFWPGISDDIKKFIERCLVCEKNQRSQVKDPILQKDIPEFAFQIVASDLFHFNGAQYLLIADSYSGFFDFEKLKSVTSNEVIEILKKWFATHGVPQIFESDNGPQYASQVFKKFAENWKFKHRTSSPRFARSNGLAERFVQIAKNLLRKCEMDNSDVQLALLYHRNTSPSAELCSPNERLINRKTNNPITFNVEMLKPTVWKDISNKIKNKRDKQKLYADKGSTEKTKIPALGDNVRIQVAHRRWVGGKVIELADSPRSVVIQTTNGQVLRRNQAHVAKTKADFTNERNPSYTNLPNLRVIENEESLQPNRNSEDIQPRVQPQLDDTQTGIIPTTYITRSGRQIKPVKKLDI